MIYFFYFIFLFFCCCNFVEKDPLAKRNWLISLHGAFCTPRIWIKMLRSNVLGRKKRPLFMFFQPFRCKSALHMNNTTVTCGCIQFLDHNSIYLQTNIFFSLYFLFNQTIWNDNITSIMPKIRTPKCINAWCKSRKNCDEKPQNLSSRIRNYLYLKCAKQFLIDQSAVAGRQSHQTMGRKIG